MLNSSDELWGSVEKFRKLADVGVALVDGAEAFERPRRVIEARALAGDTSEFAQVNARLALYAGK